MLGFFNTTFIKDNLLIIIVLEAAIKMYISLRQYLKCAKASIEPVRPFLKTIKMT